MRALVQLSLVLLLISAGATQSISDRAAEIREIGIDLGDDKVTIAVDLTSTVLPEVIIATKPDRLVLQLPNTSAPRKQQSVSVNQNGVKDVRVGLNQSAPPVTRVVVDLNTAHPYELAMTGSKITLTVLPISAVVRSSQFRPAASSSGSMITRLWRRQPNTLSSAIPGAAGVPLVIVASKQPADTLRTRFMIKYVAEGAAYLQGGRNAWLAQGMKLAVRDSAPSATGNAAARDSLIAELQVIAVAQNSAVTEIHNAKRPLRKGDWAYLSVDDIARIVYERATAATSKGPPMNSFVADDSGPRRERNHLSADEGRHGQVRIGLDYSGIRSEGSTPGGSGQRGLTIQADIAGIAGTHWNLQGYFRTRLTANSQPLEDTMQDALSKTYTLQLFYDNPQSQWLAGVGRLYLPWAISLDTIDGGYLGRRVASGLIAGVFAGSTPDPSSWHYNPDQRIAGAFVNKEGGSYDSFHYSSTAGAALSTLQWKLDRPYLFFENSLSYTRYFSIYHSLIADSPQGVTTGGIRPGAGISRSYLTLHVQPNERIQFDLFHNYFRDVPTAATRLIGAGLVDKLLYQGINLGIRVEPVRHVWVYTTLGQSDRTGDTRRSLNQMYGLTWNEIGRSGIRADVHYSKFDSSFARGDYRAVSLSGHLGNHIAWDTRVGDQRLVSPYTTNRRSLFFDTSLDTNLGRHSFLQSGYTIERGAEMNYDQWYLSLGYRFAWKQSQNDRAVHPPGSERTSGKGDGDSALRP